MRHVIPHYFMSLCPYLAFTSIYNYSYKSWSLYVFLPFAFLSFFFPAHVLGCRFVKGWPVNIGGWTRKKNQD